MQQFYDNIELDPEVGAVIVGFDQHFSYLKLLKTSLYLQDENCLFLCTDTDETFPGKNKIMYPGTGSLVSAIKSATGREPSILGKPERFAFDVLQRQHDLIPCRVMMVGDR